MEPKNATRRHIGRLFSIYGQYDTVPRILRLHNHILRSLPVLHLTLPYNLQHSGTYRTITAVFPRSDGCGRRTLKKYVTEIKRTQTT